MASVTLELPTMLAAAAGGARKLEVEGATLEEALRDAWARHPALEVHVCDESGDLRQHVLCFHNDVNTRWSESMDQPLADGDRITILQAVSGG